MVTSWPADRAAAATLTGMEPTGSAATDQREHDIRMLLARLGAAMIATGPPVHEIEEELLEVGGHLGYPGVQVGAGPTSITVAMHEGATATFESVRATLRLDQATDVRRIRHQLAHDELDPARALAQLEALRSRPPRYPTWVATPAYLAVTMGIALILQPGWANVALAGGCGAVVVALVQLSRHSPLLATLLPTVAAFVVAMIVFGSADAGLIEGPLRTVLPALAVLLPGALIVTGMSELAAGQMQAGSARLIYGTVQLGLFALGLVAALSLLALPSPMMVNERVDDIGWVAAPLGLLLIGVGIALMESVPLRMLPWVLLVLLGAFGAQTLGQILGPAGLGGFLGAIAASLGASLVELRRPQLARLVLFLPAFWLLVPGSLGLVGVTQLVVDPGEALDAGLGVVAVICAIALGLLVGSSIGHSLRGRLRRG